MISLSHLLDNGVTFGKMNSENNAVLTTYLFIDCRHCPKHWFFSESWSLTSQ